MVSLPKARNAIPPALAEPISCRVCLAADGTIYLNGRRQPSLAAMERNLSAANEVYRLNMIHLAADKRTPYRLAYPVLALCGEMGHGPVVLDVDSGDSDINWMDDLAGFELCVSTLDPMPTAKFGPAIKADKILLSGQPVEVKELESLLRERWEISIYPDPDVTFGRIVEIIGELDGWHNFYLPPPGSPPPASQPSDDAPGRAARRPQGDTQNQISYQ